MGSSPRRQDEAKPVTAPRLAQLMESYERSAPQATTQEAEALGAFVRAWGPARGIDRLDPRALAAYLRRLAPAQAATTLDALGPFLVWCRAQGAPVREPAALLVTARDLVGADADRPSAWVRQVGITLLCQDPLWPCAGATSTRAGAVAAALVGESGGEDAAHLRGLVQPLVARAPGPAWLIEWLEHEHRLSRCQRPLAIAACFVDPEACWLALHASAGAAVLDAAGQTVRCWGVLPAETYRRVGQALREGASDPLLYVEPGALLAQAPSPVLTESRPIGLPTPPHGWVVLLGHGSPPAVLVVRLGLVQDESSPNR